MQDFTGVPCVVDLATCARPCATGGDPTKVTRWPADGYRPPSSPTSGRPDAFERNVEFEYGRNKERYQFLRWARPP
jgi:aconitate hydratase